MATSPAELHACLGSRVHLQLAQYTLRMVPGGVSTNGKGLGDGDIREPLRQQHGDFGLPGREAKLHLDVRGPGRCEVTARGCSSRSLLPQLLRRSRISSNEV